LGRIVPSIESKEESSAAYGRDSFDLLSYVPAAARRVLDCACGDGTLARRLKERGPVEVVGITSDADTSQHARESLDHVIVSDLRELRLPFDDDYFDCVICDDVLPALRDPEPVLKEIVRTLSAQGLMVLIVPNVHYYKVVVMLAEGRWDYTESGVLARRHLRFFTGVELGRLLRASGLANHRCIPLVMDRPETLPRDADGYLTFGRIRIGPLNDEEYASLCTEEYLVLARKSAPVREA